VSQFELHHGDCLEILKTLPANSVDSIVTDPPYELGFMGKSWDASGIAYNVDMWREALRVLKPGGHLLAFSGSRTYHRMTCAIEDAGFEIRDQIMWVYGSGFPKSLDVSKAIGKTTGASAVDGESEQYFETQPDGTTTSIDPAEVYAYRARQWEGWGTALKPAHEPICVARKPLVGTVAANVLQFGTGALNIDACRVGTSGGCKAEGGGERKESQPGAIGAYESSPPVDGLGRWPANLIHDGSDEVVALFPAQAGQQAAIRGTEASVPAKGDVAYGFRERVAFAGHNDTGSAARFFYCPKASKSDRGEGNNHPTVKPTELMRYLVRLVTPPGGLVLDPFMGSGSTGKAAMLEGVRFVGIDLTAEYIDIARDRIENELIGDLV